MLVLTRLCYVQSSIMILFGNSNNSYVGLEQIERLCVARIVRMYFESRRSTRFWCGTSLSDRFFLWSLLRRSKWLYIILFPVESALHSVKWNFKHFRFVQPKVHHDQDPTSSKGALSGLPSGLIVRQVFQLNELNRYIKIYAETILCSCHYAPSHSSVLRYDSLYGTRQARRSLLH